MKELRQIQTADSVGMGRKSCLYTIFQLTMQCTGTTLCPHRLDLLFVFASLPSLSILRRHLTILLNLWLILNIEIRRHNSKWDYYEPVRTLFLFLYWYRCIIVHIMYRYTLCTGTCTCTYIMYTLCTSTRLNRYIDIYKYSPNPTFVTLKV